MTKRAIVQEPFEKLPIGNSFLHAMCTASGGGCAIVGEIRAGSLVFKSTTLVHLPHHHDPLSS